MKNRFSLLTMVMAIALAIPMTVNAQESKNEQETLKKEVQEIKGKVDRMPKVYGFVQGLYQMDIKDNQIESNTFRMRRVRMAVDGNLSKHVSYKIQGDWVNSPILVDAHLKVKVCPEFSLQFGQFKTPFTLESPSSPINLEIFDFGETVKNLCGYSDVCGVGKNGRDIGAMASGNLFKIEDKDFSILEYSIGIFNGNNINAVDNNNHKDLIGRINIHPMLKSLTLTGSIYRGMYFNQIDLTRNRYSFGVQYSDNNMVFRSEYVGGETGTAVEALNEDGTSFMQESLFNSNGYYAVAGYWFRFGKDNNQKLMPVIRYEHFDKDIHVEGQSEYYTVGINYWPLKSVNFKLDYSLVQKNSTELSHRIVALLSYKF